MTNTSRKCGPYVFFLVLPLIPPLRSKTCYMIDTSATMPPIPKHCWRKPMRGKFVSSPPPSVSPIVNFRDLLIGRAGRHHRAYISEYAILVRVDERRCPQSTMDCLRSLLLVIPSNRIIRSIPLLGILGKARALAQTARSMFCIFADARSVIPLVLLRDMGAVKIAGEQRFPSGGL